MPETEYITTEAALKLSGITTLQTLKRWHKLGKIEAVQGFTGRWMFERNSLLLALGITPPEPEPEPDPYEAHRLFRERMHREKAAIKAKQKAERESARAAAVTVR